MDESFLFFIILSTNKSCNFLFARFFLIFKKFIACIKTSYWVKKITIRENWFKKSLLFEFFFNLVYSINKIHQ